MIIFIALGILAAVQTYIGIEMVNSPPENDSQKWRWRILFFVTAVAMVVVGCIQFVEGDAQQKDFNNRLIGLQTQLTNSIAENLDLRHEMREQFEQLTEDFSTNSSIAVAIRVGVLNKELDKTIAEGNELEKSHELFNASPVDITAVRAEREQELSIQANQAKQEKLQEELRAIQAQQDAAKQAVQNVEQERQSEQDRFDRERALSARAIPIFDYVVEKFYKSLAKVTDGTEWRMFSDFRSAIPTVYASDFLRNGIVVSGTNFISVGTNSAWRFAISTAITPIPSAKLREWDGQENYASLVVEAAATNGDSKLIVTPHFFSRSVYNRYMYFQFQKHHISGDYWFDRVDVSLDVPNGLNMSESPSYDDYTNVVDRALSRLIGAQDQQSTVPVKTN